MGDKLKETSEETHNEGRGFLHRAEGGGLLNGFKITLNMCQDLQNPQTFNPQSSQIQGFQTCFVEIRQNDIDLMTGKDMHLQEISSRGDDFFF